MALPESGPRQDDMDYHDWWDSLTDQQKDMLQRRADGESLGDIISSGGDLMLYLFGLPYIDIEEDTQDN